MRFLKIPEAAECVQCSEGCIRDMIASGKLHAVRLGKTDHGDYRIAEIALIELGAGGPRPIVLNVTTVTENVTEAGASGRAVVRPRARLGRNGSHV